MISKLFLSDIQPIYLQTTFLEQSDMYAIDIISDNKITKVITGRFILSSMLLYKAISDSIPVADIYGFKDNLQTSLSNNLFKISCEYYDDMYFCTIHSNISEEPTYFDINNKHKFDISSFVKDSKFSFIIDDICNLNETFDNGNIGYDIFKIIDNYLHKLNFIDFKIAGGVGVSINDEINSIQNSNGFALIYHKKFDVSEFFNIQYPSLQIHSSNDYKLLLEKIVKPKNVTSYLTKINLIIDRR